MLVVAVLAPVPYGTHGMVVEGLRQEFLNDPDIRVFYFYSRGFDIAHIVPRMYEILSERCDILITVGIQCSAIARDVLKDLRNPIFQVITTVDKSYVSIADDRDRVAFVSYGYVSADAYASYLALYKPEARRVLCPILVDERSDWADLFFEKIKRQFVLRNMELKPVRSENPLDLQTVILKNYKECDTILLPEGTASLYFHRMCSHLANLDKKTLYVGGVEGVRMGTAVIGYGGDFSLISAEAARISRSFLRTGEAPREVEVFLPRVSALNTILCSRQSIDQIHARKVCKENAGLLFETIGDISTRADFMFDTEAAFVDA